MKGSMTLKRLTKAQKAEQLKDRRDHRNALIHRREFTCKSAARAAFIEAQIKRTEAQIAELAGTGILAS